MAKILYNVITLLALLVSISESRIQLERGLLSNEDLESAYQAYPYMFANSPRARSTSHGGLQRAADNDVDADDEDAIGANNSWMEDEKLIQVATDKKSSKTGSILVPDGIIEVEGHTVYDEKTGKATLLVAKEALNAIPNGSIVALLDQSVNVNANDAHAEEEERANRVLVRRRKKGSRINVRAGNNKRRSSNTVRRNNNRRGSSKNRSRRPTVQVAYATNNNRRRTNRRRPSRVVPIIVSRYDDSIY